MLLLQLDAPIPVPCLDLLRLHAPAPLAQAKEAEAALVQLAEERNAIVGEKDAAVRQVVDLQNQVGCAAACWGDGVPAVSWVGAAASRSSRAMQLQSHMPERDSIHNKAHTNSTGLPFPGSPQVDALKQEVAEARGAGTPHGEAAKKVSRLALERVRELQLQVCLPCRSPPRNSGLGRCGIRGHVALSCTAMLDSSAPLPAVCLPAG